MTPSIPPTVVFIMGPGHCGSTLLDLLLGSHSSAFSLGELWQVGKLLKRRDLPSRLCGVCTGPCDFWDEAVPDAILRRHFESDTRWGRLRRRAAPFLWNLHGALFEASGRRVLIDSSKAPSWIRRQLRPAHQWRHTRPFLIYLVRDGRAVANSYLRKYPDRGMPAWAGEWARRTEGMNAYFEGFPPGDRMRVAYEDLAADPAAVVRRVCAALGLPFEEEMLRYWTHDHHILGGNNPGTRSLILRWREGEERSRAGRLRGRGSEAVASSTRRGWGFAWTSGGSASCRQASSRSSRPSPVRSTGNSDTAEWT